MHRLRRQNCQDAAFWRQATPDLGCGVVLDGCGSKFQDEGGFHSSHNEVGAHLLGAFIANFIGNRLLSLPQSAVDQCLIDTHLASRSYLQGLLELFSPLAPDERRRFIMTQLLCTVVGFVILPETAVCFWQGDGYLRIDDHIFELNDDNQPDYLAYNLFDNQCRRVTFHTLHLLRRPELLAAATDGWQMSQLQQLPTPQNNLHLQRLLNQQSQKQGFFDDDGAIVHWELGS
jgi:hypothetical protein